MGSSKWGPTTKRTNSVAKEPSWWGAEVHKQPPGRGEMGRALRSWGVGAHLTYEMGATSTRCEVEGEECTSQPVPPVAPAHRSRNQGS